MFCRGDGAVVVVMVVMVMMVMVSGVVGASAAGNVDVKVASRKSGDARGVEGMMVRAAWGNGSSLHSGDSREGGGRAVSRCYTCGVSGCNVPLSCTMPEAMCWSGFEVATEFQMAGCASKSVCDQYARAYACDVDITMAYTGYCCCNSDMCNSDIRSCQAEILNKCRNGAVTVAGRLGGLTAMLTLLLPLLLA